MMGWSMPGRGSSPPRVPYPDNMQRGALSRQHDDSRRGLVEAWSNATGKRWDRLPTRARSQIEPYLQRARSRPEVRFCIFAQGRTGSSLLRSLLNTHPEITCVGEVLGPDPVLFPVRFVERHARLTDTPAFGFKVKIYQLTRHQGLADPARFLTALTRRGYHLLYLHRRNVLRQAISNSFALAAGRYHLRAGEKPDVRAIRVDPDRILEVMNRRQEHTELERSVLGDVDAHTLDLAYEDHLLDPSSHQSTVDTIVSFLGLSASVEVTTRFQRIVTGALRERIANFDEVERALAGTPFADMVDDPAYL